MVNTVPTPPLTGLHNIRIPVNDLDRSIEWYTRVFGFDELMEFTDHGTRTGMVLIHSSGARLILMIDPKAAAAMREPSPGLGPVALGVADRAQLAEWVDRLNALGIENEGSYQGHLGWTIPHIKDPDGLEIRIYTEEVPDTLPDYH
ncbi:MAG: VOC family protein [Microbacteriaceae bacterium]|nr:MAG: VOC family protein [Microbacteriaceae bacterium]